jgi:hypothetical protein
MPAQRSFAGLTLGMGVATGRPKQTVLRKVDDQEVDEATFRDALELMKLDLLSQIRDRLDRLGKG